MNTTGHSEGRPVEERPENHESVADDRFVHGLLEFLHKDTDETREGRIDAVLDRIGQARETPRHRLVMRLIPFASAAVLILAVVTVVILTPQSTAYAMVGQAIKATRLAPQLRYEITITDPALPPERQQMKGAIDMRGELVRVQIEMPNGSDFIMGRDSQGEWSLHPDGSVERLEPRASAPRWINVGDSTILVGGLDVLLDELRDDDYAIEQVNDRETSPSGEEVTELVATRRRGAANPGPDRIRVWIDNGTSLVERLELQWTRSVPPDQRRETAQPDEEDPAARDGRPHPPRRDSGPRPLHAELLSEGPRFNDRRHPPPPELIVFERVPSIDISEDGFSPPDR